MTTFLAELLGESKGAEISGV